MMRMIDQAAIKVMRAIRTRRRGRELAIPGLEGYAPASGAEAHTGASYGLLRRTGRGRAKQYAATAALAAAILVGGWGYGEFRADAADAAQKDEVTFYRDLYAEEAEKADARDACTARAKAASGSQILMSMSDRERAELAACHAEQEAETAAIRAEALQAAVEGEGR